MLDIRESSEKKVADRALKQSSVLKAFNERRRLRQAAATTISVAIFIGDGHGAELVRTESAATTTSATSSVSLTQEVHNIIDEVALDDGDNIDEDGTKLKKLFLKRKKTWNSRPDGWEIIGEHLAEFGREATLSAFKDKLISVDLGLTTPDGVHNGCFETEAHNGCFETRN
jgi:hypothetical protein